MNLRSVSFLGIFLLLASFTGLAQPDREEAAIREIILLETYSWEQRDYDTWRACWAQTDYATHHVPLQGMALIGWDTIDLYFRENAFFADGGQAMAESHRGKNFQIRRMGNLAHVIYVQEDILGEQVTEQFEMRLLEKIGGQWKIVSVVAAPLANGSETFTRSMLDRASLNYSNARKPEKAIEVLEKHLELFPGDFSALERIADMHYTLGNTEEARKYYAAILEADPDHDLARRRMERL